jgi:DNA-binding GntR family transcriptional regulator
MEPEVIGELLCTVILKCMRLYETTAKAIRDKIISGEYELDAELPSHLDLAVQYDVGGITMSRAMHLLANEGYLVIAQGVRTRVAAELPKPDRRALIRDLRQKISGAAKALADAAGILDQLAVGSRQD